MSELNISNLLMGVFGARGLPFPGKPDIVKVSNVSFPGQPNPAVGSPVASGFEYSEVPQKERSRIGSPLHAQNSLGRWVFMPAKLSGVELPNPLINITGGWEIVEESVTEVGYVFENVYMRPYDITIICTLINETHTWPEDELIEMSKLFKKGDVHTLECAITDIFLQAERNLLITDMDVMDMRGVENAQIIQFTGKSNIDFELEIL